MRFSRIFRPDDRSAFPWEAWFCLGDPRVHAQPLDRRALPVAAIVGATGRAEAVCGGASHHVLPAGGALLLLELLLLLLMVVSGEAGGSDPLARRGDGLRLDADALAGVDGEAGALR